MQSQDEGMTNMNYWNKKGKEFDDYAKRWNSEQEYILYGAGNLGKEFFDKFSKEINIIGFCDSDNSKINTLLCNRNVYDIEKIKTNKIIVTSRFYYEIKEKLEKINLKEDIDFTNEQKFEAVYMFYKYDLLYFREYDISITPSCTLKCQFCNMQMHKFKDKSHFKIENIKEEIDTYFKWVDYVQYLGILGGEPFLHPNLYELLDYIAVKYRKRMTRLELLTNGTCIPSDELCNLLYKHNISVQFSDYSNGLPQLKSIHEKFLNKLNKYNIPCYIFHYDNWLDFGLKDNLNETEEQLREKYSLCNHFWRSVYDNKYFYCNLQTSAVRAGLTGIANDDIFDLSDFSKERKVELLEYDLKNNAKGYLSFCRVCKGCSAVNECYVEPAIQVINSIQ